METISHLESIKVNSIDRWKYIYFIYDNGGNVLGKIIINIFILSKSEEFGQISHFGILNNDDT